MYTKLVVNVDILQIKIYQKILDIFMDLLSEIRNPVLFSPHKHVGCVVGRGISYSFCTQKLY